MDDANHTPDTPTTTAKPARRWLRRSLLALAALLLVLAGAGWLLGRESTLRELVRRIAAASGGEIAVSAVSGSLYHRMHIGHVQYRGADSVITADDIAINWSPLQFFSGGVEISELHVASLTVRSTRPSPPPTLPTSLAAPFHLTLSDARVDRLVLLDVDGSRNEIDRLHLRLTGGRERWQVADASALTELGMVRAEATVAAQRPFALTGTASLTQSAAAAGQAPARIAMQARGTLSLLELSATATANRASGDATLQVAPFDPVMLRAVHIEGRNLDPSGFNPAWPHANLSLNIAARIAAGQDISGTVELHNPGQAGPLDQQRLPLQSLSARLGGTLTAAKLDDVALDLGTAGRFDGGGSIERSAPDAGIGSANFTLHTTRLNLQGISSGLKPTAIAGSIALRDKGAASGDQLSLNAALAQDGLRLDLQATLAHALLHIEQARLLAKSGSISLTAQASLSDAQAFKASASVTHFDPSALGAYPSADINADASASGHLSPAWQTSASFTIKPSKLTGVPLSGTGRLDADALHVSGVAATLAFGPNTADLRGSFGASGEKLDWHVAAKQLSAVRSDMLGALNASGIVSGGMDAPRTSFEADAKGLGLTSAKHLAPNSALHASGEAWLAGPQRRPEIKLSGSVQRLDPAAFGAYPAGSINADINGDARLARDWHAHADVRLLPSTLSNAPLSGHAALSADATHIEQADIDLHLDAGSLQAHGGFGSARDRLDWRFDAPQLATLGPQFAGALHASGTLAGSVAQPALNLSLDGDHVRLPGQRQLASVRGSASMASDGAVNADLSLNSFASPALNLDRARLQASGTRAAHALQLSAASPGFDAALRIKGGFVADGWNGAIDTLQNRGRFAFTLAAPAPLRLNGAAGSGLAGLAHPQQIALSGFALNLPSGAVHIDGLEKNGAQWSSKGQAVGVPVNYLAQLSDAWRDNVKSDMTLGAAWALNLQAAQQGGTPAIAGTLHVYREQGDIIVNGTDLPLPLGLRQLDARADVTNGVLHAQFLMDGSHGGQLRLNAGVQLHDGHLADDSPLTLSGNANMGSISWLAPLTGLTGLELDGTLKAALNGSGTVGTPQLSGDISGQQLAVNWADQGVKLRNGKLQATLSGGQLQLQQLTFDGTQGHAQADGWLRYADAEASMQLKLTADRLEVLARPDRTLTVSGQGTLVRDARHFDLTGKFKADHASIELASQDTPTLSDDVVIVGKGTPAARPATQSMPLNIDLEADLGDDFNLKGKGLDAQLAGAVRVRVTDRRPPRVIGGIRVVSGTYAAYGQKLAIERGVINFTGAYDNPGLNILAVRKRPDDEPLSDTNVEAGVEVRGTALAPSAKLVSTPAVSDSDKLAWLVLGHGMDTAGGNDMALLGAAAGALFGGGQGQLANKLGVDELGVGQVSGAPVAGQASALQTTVVTVGKRISSRAYLSFEQGTSTATSLVKLRYKLTPRITLQLQTGTNNALDVLYTWAFD